MSAEDSDPVRAALTRASLARADDVRPAAPVASGARRARLLPAALRGARWSVGASAAVAVLVLASVLGVLTLVRQAGAVPGVPVPVASPAGPAEQSTAAPPRSTQAGDPAGVALATGVVGTAPSPASPSGQVVVHVVGAVAAPGVVRLDAGSRVSDAVAAAGGAAADADLARLNLARVLVDGEQVLVPRPGETLAPVPGPPAVTGSGAGGSVGPVDLNSATLAELDTLPGIGPVLAQRILDWRTEHGRFSSVAELGEVSGIGDAVLADLDALVTV